MVMSLGSRIASMRGYRRMSQEVLGNKLGVTKQTISGWERDRRADKNQAKFSLLPAVIL